MYGQSECSEQTTGQCTPVLEQFLTIKDSSTFNEEEVEEEFEDEQGNHDPENDSEDKNMKSDWLKSVQLWNQPDPLLPKEVIILENPYIVTQDKISRRQSKYFHFAFQEQSQQMMETVVKRDESMREDANAMANSGERRRRETERKQRRCWSHELHRRFLNALKQLGGPHGAFFDFI